MDSDYVFLCGMMWCRFGQQDAGKELLRAAHCGDPDTRALAWTMLTKGARRLRGLESGHNLIPARYVGKNYVDETMRYL
jgi:hypothetical protein